MVEIPDGDFEKMVTDEYDATPGEMFGDLENVAILVANPPIEERPRLFGPYSGHPITTGGDTALGRCQIASAYIRTICRSTATI